MVANNGAPVRIILVATGTALLAACATPAPPPPPPPPPAAAAQTIPYRPLPPFGAAYVMDIPPRGPDGVRRTVNTGISDDELVWHFRSGWNVAALNCSRSRYQSVVDAYSKYITDNRRALRRVNSRIEQTYRDKAATRKQAIQAREQQMTMVYNFFALPPARVNFCRAALDISNRAAASPKADPVQFARDNFALLTAPFEDFYTRYEQYQRASADWDARWGERYGYSQPGYVAVQRHKQRIAREEAARRLAQSQQVSGDGTTQLVAPAGGVVDPVTGATVPVVPAPETTVSVPVVEPIPADQPAPDATN